MVMEPSARNSGATFRRLTGLVGRDEAGEDRLFRVDGSDGQDIRQDAIKPGHLPFGALGKNSLYQRRDELQSLRAGRSAIRRSLTYFT